MKPHWERDDITSPAPKPEKPINMITKKSGKLPLNWDRKLIKFFKKLFFISIIILLSSCYVKLPTQKAVVEYVGDGIYRGPHIDDYNFLIELGIKTVISLEEEKDYVHLNGIANEGAILFTYNIKFISIPLSDNFLDPPKPVTLHLIATSMNESTKPLYVHCTRGIDRTGFAVASYRMIYQDWTFDQAYKELLDRGHSADYFYIWKKSLRQLKETL